MPDGLYERDALEWSEQQAELLRRLAAGERVNEAVDWANVIEELQELGRSELHGCESLLMQALRHLLKLHIWPDELPPRHWKGEIATFLAGARRRYTPSMRQRIDLDGIYAEAVHTVMLDREAGQHWGLPERCPFSLDALMRDRPDVSELLSMLDRKKNRLRT